MEEGGTIFVCEETSMEGTTPYTQGHLDPDYGAAFGLLINQEFLSSVIHRISRSLLMIGCFRPLISLSSGELQYVTKR